MSQAKIPAKGQTPHETWKDALHESVHRSELPAKAIADVLGIPRSTLGKVCDPNEPDNLSSKHLPALAGTTSNLAWLDYLEARAGRQAYVLPEPGALCSLQTIAALKEFSEFLASVADGVADGTVSPEDIARIEREGHEAIAAISTVMATARAQAPKGDAPPRPGPTAVVADHPRAPRAGDRS